MSKNCTYTLKGPDGQDVTLTGQAAIKAFLVNGGLQYLREPSVTRSAERLFNGKPVKIGTSDEWSIYKHHYATLGDGRLTWVEDSYTANITDIHAGKKTRGTAMVRWLGESTGKEVNAIGVVEDAQEFWDKMEEEGLINFQTDEDFMDYFGLRKSTERNITDAPEFRKWFGDSKVVDAEGKPLVVYHGTGSVFSAFDEGRRGRNFSPGQHGFFFTSSASDAGSYANYASESGGLVLPVYLSIQNPLTAEEFADAVSSSYEELAEGQDVFSDQVEPETIFDLHADKVMRLALKLGRDGVVFSIGEKSLYVAFHPEQIKSATGNRGTFDPADPDITRSAERFTDDQRDALEQSGRDAEEAIRSAPRNYDVDLSAQQEAEKPAKAWIEKVYAELPRNPMAPRQRMMVFGEDDFALLELAPSGLNPGGVTIQWIQAYPLRSGNGTKAIRELQRLAAEGGIELDLWPWDKGRVSQANLIKFYKSVGFEPMRRGSKDMIWRPGQEARRSTERGLWYSQLSRAIESVPARLDNQSGVQWAQWLKANAPKLGVKQDEITWSGIEDFLKLKGKAKVSKDEIGAYLAEGGVRVGEVVLGGDADREPEMIGVDDDGEAIYDDGVQDGTKYSQYTLPGATNYREVLLTLPEPKLADIESWTPGRMKAKRDVFIDAGFTPLGVDVAIAAAFEAGGVEAALRSLDAKVGSGVYKESQKEARDILRSAVSGERKNKEKRLEALSKASYKSTHWDQKNVLAHIRLNDRTDADGKRVLFVEELQSDFAQDARKKGIARNYKPEEVQPISAVEAGFMTRADEELFWFFKTPDNTFQIPKAKYQDRDAARDYIVREKKVNSGGVPNAPFIDDTSKWLNLALKRVIKMAVDEGYDAVAFVNGEQSAERYDLSKQLDTVLYDRRKNGSGGEVIGRKDGYNAITKEILSDDELADVVGKEVAKKLLEAPLNAYGMHELKGLDLKVGGEGMLAFYNAIVPQAASALVKKMGGEGMTTLSVANEDRARKIADAEARQLPDSHLWGVYLASTNEWLVGDDGTTSNPNIAGAYSERAARSAADAMNRTARELQQRPLLQQPGFLITDSMREKASGPMPLFSRERAETPEFKAWFKDSKVVDEQGRPLVVYHGGRPGIAAFNNPNAYRPGIFFTDNKGVADAFGKGGETYAVYLSIKRPFVVDAAGEYYSEIPRPMEMEDFAATDTVDADLVAEWAFRNGYDGVVLKNLLEGRGDQVSDVYIASKNTQIKSAIGNDGSYDENDPSILSSAARNWESPGASKFDDTVYLLQDKNIDLKRVIDSIVDTKGEIRNDVNTYLQEELFHGRAAKRTEDFVSKELQPLTEAMRDRGLTIEELDEYLHARHAKEANELVASRNPDSADLQDGGSGMTTQAAQDYLNGLPADKRDHLQAVAAMVDKILDKTRRLVVDYELESKDTVDGWAQMFEHYVPLIREDDGDAPSGLGTGQGFSIKGREVKSRTGSTKKVVDILANIALQRERVIVRGEKNRVSQSLVGLAKLNPNEEFWTVDLTPTTPTYDPKKGVVVQRPDPLFKSRPNVVVAKVREEDGSVKEHAVIFNEKSARALRTASALKNLDMTPLGGIMGASAVATRYFASINTQYNPIFGVVNLVRDVQGALINLQSTPLAGKQKAIALAVRPALSGIFKDARSARKGKESSGAWAALWEDFQSVGGQTGFRQLFQTSEDRAKAIRKAIDPDAWTQSRLGKIFTANGTLRVPMARAMRGARWVFDLLSDYNLAMENGIRLAAYKAGLDAGLPKEQAASIAKNLTVNFNRRGQIGQQAGAIYAFFNAASQSTARLAQVMFTMEPGKPKTIRLSKLGQRVAAGGVMLGAVQAFALAAAGFGDDDPPDFVRERSLIIPTGGKSYIQIPMPLGLHVLPNIGRMTVEWALDGFTKTPQRVVKFLGLMADAFNPIGNAGLSMQTIAPTVFDPLVALTENRDFTGRPIAKESHNKAIPGHSLSRDTDTLLAQLIAEGINAATGGNEYVAGAISPKASQIDYLIGQLTGGVGRELSKLEQTARGGVTGEDVPIHKIPLAGRFYGNAASQASEGNAFYANSEELNRLETEIKGLQKAGKAQEAAALRASRPDAYLIAQANAAERQISKLRQQKLELVRAGAPREQIRAVEEKITARMASLNRAAESLREKAGT